MIKRRTFYANLIHARLLFAILIIFFATSCNKEPEHTHSWDSGTITSAATCTRSGVRTYTCSGCNFTRTEEIPAKGHDFQTIEAKAPTCTEKGWGEYRKCKICNVTDGYVEKAAGHTFSSAWSKDAYTHWHKAICEHSTEKGDEASHSWDSGTAISPVTCTSGGIISYTCTVCGQTKTESVPATGHNYQTIEAKTPTCTEKGWEEYRKCRTCNVTVGYVEKSALGHSYSEAWSTDSQYHWHASTCGHQDEVREKSEHTWNSDNICTVCNTKNEGSGGITISTTKYTLSIDFPNNWKGSLTVVPNVLATLKAKLTPASEDATFVFFLQDGTTVQEILGDTLELGIGDGKYQLEKSIYVLTVNAVVDEKIYSQRYVIRVSETGSGIADTQTTI